MKYKCFKWLGAALLLISGWHALHAGYIIGKATLAQYLLEQAWQNSKQGEQVKKPWQWADSWPVARLHLPHQPPMIVLSGATGRALAFAPGHLSASALPGNPGTVVISGHRDTHFSHLAELTTGDVLTLEARQQKIHYQVIKTKIADTRTEKLVLNNSFNQLILVTCYPFDALETGGPYRYIVQAIQKKTKQQLKTLTNAQHFTI
ncbi:class GN sortase [Zooshikella marina]|uniref:Class GN sortase n=1 Tax=Zooshikella ganghwensis TaxID=202772 RepID=A0A4P9VPV2_9GAMM|nr:class GN sortase [Zooshikella ganghwensis]MBU2707397.1 class GN sortase [Zooshikella ganghwensis]RDH45503.1 class GN sortase [Zooshikella ganghwensis]